MPRDFDYERLRLMIRRMRRWHKLYRVLHEELSHLGYWKALPRANPRAGYLAGLAKHKEGKH